MPPRSVVGDPSGQSAGKANVQLVAANTNGGATFLLLDDILAQDIDHPLTQRKCWQGFEQIIHVFKTTSSQIPEMTAHIHTIQQCD